MISGLLLLIINRLSWYAAFTYMLIIITDNYPLYKFENPEKVVLKELLCFAIFSVDPVSQMFSFDECVLSV